MNKLNLTEILKDCHKGTKFYSRFLGFVEFCNITSDNYIEVMDKNECHIEFKPNGTYKHSEENAEIDLFPSKDQRDWSKWQRPFVDGDIVINKNNIGTWIGIYHKDDRLNETFSSYCYIRRDGIFCANSDNNHGYYETRLATKEEKEKFFQVIKDHGYKWNFKTKTLEKLIIPKFKVGDKVIKKGCSIPVLISEINDGNYYSITENSIGSFKIKEQDNWELIPNKFDPKTLKPFDKVLVRQYNEHWHIQFFETMYKDRKKYPFVCLGGKIYSYCIPYNDDTKHLVNKMDEAPEFYRYWEN